MPETKLLTLNQAIDIIKEGNLSELEKLPMAQIIDVACEYREIIRAEDKEIKRKKANFEILENIILQQMKDAGTDESPMLIAGGLKATASVSINEVPTATDWQKIFEWIKENDGFHLLQKRISSAAWKSEIALGEEIEGIEKFEQRKLSLRARPQ